MQSAWKRFGVGRALSVVFPQDARKAWLFRVPVRVATKLNRPAMIAFYSRNNHGSRSLLKQYLARVAFYEAIDSEIRRDPKKVGAFGGITMVSNAAKVWSQGLEGNEAYYLDPGMSCLNGVIEELTQLDSPSGSVLELGCAVGNCIGILNERVGANVQRLTGLDISREAVDYARERFKSSPRCEFVTTDILDWLRAQPSSTDPAYDVVFSHLVFQFLARDSVVEIYRNLNAKKLCRTVIVSDSYCDASPDLSQLSDSVYNPGAHGLYRFDHNHAALMTEAGLKNACVTADHRATSGFVFFRAECG